MGAVELNTLVDTWPADSLPQLIFHLGVKVDSLNEHPEDGGLEAEHEETEDSLADPRLTLVPGQCGNGRE